MDKKVYKKIQQEIKEMENMGYDLNKVIIILNDKKFKRDRFEILGVSVTYSNKIDKPYIYRYIGSSRKTWR